MATSSTNGISLNANLPALLAGRQLQENQLNLSRSIQRLSTGLRINSPADDSSGFALASRLQAKIGLLEQGTLNAQDAVSVIQTASGGTQQILGILQQLNSLAARATGASLTSTDRQGIQTQITQLVSQINQIASTTKFGDQALLDGSIRAPRPSSATALAVATNAFLGAAATPMINTVNVAVASVLSPLSNATCFLDEAFEFVIVSSTVSSNSFIVNVFASGTAVTAIVATLIISPTVAGNATLVPITVASSAAGGATFVATLDFRGITVADISSIVGKTAFASSTAFEPAISTDSSLQVQVGAGVGEILRFSSPSVLSSALFSSQAVDVTTFLGAEGALVQVQHALNIANQAAATLGAFQNRFQTVLTTNQVFEQNLQAARSQIVDLDVARETTNLVRGQLLVQTTSAVLAQANLLPGVFLQLITAR